MSEQKTEHNFLKLAKERKTTYEFEDVSVKPQDINTILEAARWASSCSNTQPWHFIVIKNKKTIQDLMMTANYGAFHTDPPLMIAVVLMQDKCLGKNFACFRGKDSGAHDSYVSIGMTTANIVFQAKDLGLDTCIITPTIDQAKKILKIRKKDIVPIIVGVGYQKKGAFQKKRERQSLKELVSKEYFGGKNE